MQYIDRIKNLKLVSFYLSFIIYIDLQIPFQPPTEEEEGRGGRGGGRAWEEWEEKKHTKHF